jgi:hypothetical protein
VRFVWQAILPAGGLSGRRAGWKARLQPGLAATQTGLRRNSISPAAEFDGERRRAMAAGQLVKLLYLMMSGGMM